MRLHIGGWYYNRYTDTFLYCAEMMGRKTVQTYSRISYTNLVQYASNNDEVFLKDLPADMTKGYRPFGKLRGRGYLQHEKGQSILTIPRRWQFKEQVKEMLPKGFDEESFRKLVYDFPDMLVDTYDANV